MKRRTTIRLRRSKAGYWAVICAGNGQVVWQTEVYKSRVSADQAADSMSRITIWRIVDETAKPSKR